MTRAAMFVVAVAVTAGVAARPLQAQAPVESREVRQLVTFRFLPGQTRAALDVYRTGILPVYRGVESMRMVRLLGEVESPEPLDLVVVTHYADMAGMDRANQAMRALPPDGPTIGQLYQQVADLSLGHHDQFVEMISPPVTAGTPDGLLEVLEFVRVSAGAHGAFERQMLQLVHPWEEDQAIQRLVPRTETARFLVADGWDYLRTYAVRDLAAWQAYSTARARHPGVWAANRVVEQRKTIVLRELAELRIR
jgi:hypothetical protein